MKNKERILWVVALFVVLLAFYFKTNEYKNLLTGSGQEKAMLHNENKRLEQIYYENKAAIEALEKEVENLKEELEPYKGFDETILISLKEKGFTGELKDIVLDLQSHRELIPYEGSLGGTMGFYSDEHIHVLSDKWVFAYFEDGHSFGFMLLEYDIKDGEIIWKVIDSYLF